MENDKTAATAATEETEKTNAAPEGEVKVAETPAAAEPPKAEEAPKSAAPEEKKKKKGVFKTIFKVLLWLTLGIVLLVAIALSCLLIFIDPIIKGIIEDYGPEYAGVTFEIEDIDVDLFNGRIAIKDLCMYNPEGYQSDYAVLLGDVAFDTKITSWFFGKKTIIRELRIKNITVNYEFDTKWEKGKLTQEESNIQYIVDHLQAKLNQENAAVEVASVRADSEIKYMFATQGPAPEAQEQAAPAKDDRRRFRLDKLVLENVKLNIFHKRFKDIKISAVDLTIPEQGPYGTHGKGMTGLEIAVELAPVLLVAIVESAMMTTEEAIKKSMEKAGEIKADVQDYQKRIKGLEDEWEEDPGKAIKSGTNILKDIMQNKNTKEANSIVEGLFK